MTHVMRLAGLCALVGASALVSRFALAEEEPARGKVPLVAGVARVRVEIARKHVVVIHDVNLARGGFHDEDVDAFAAFGAPGAPRAIEARLIALPPGSLEAPTTERGVALPWSYAQRRPGSAWPVLGRATMAGVIVQLPGDVLKRALEPGGMATLRLRSVHPLPASDADGQQEVLVRLGDIGGVPLVLGRVEVASSEPLVERVEARLCHTGTLGERLAVRMVAPPPPAPTRSDAPTGTTVTTVTTSTTSSTRGNGLVAPVLVPRKAGEDLCVRFVSRKTQKSGSATAAPES